MRSTSEQTSRGRAEQLNEPGPAFLGDPVIAAAIVGAFIVHEAIGTKG